MTQLRVDLNAMDEIIQTMTAVSGKLQYSRKTIITQAAHLGNSKGIEKTLKELNTAAGGLEKEIQTLNKRIRELRQVKSLYQRMESENVKLVERLPEARITGQTTQRTFSSGNVSVRSGKTTNSDLTIRVPKGLEKRRTMAVSPEAWKGYSHTGPVMTRKKMVHSEWLMRALTVYM